jgi:hypothetical protein
MPQPLKDAFLRVNPDPQKLRTMHDKDAARMRSFKDVPHAIELTRLIPGARLLTLPGGHGDYLGEVVMTQKDTHYPELTARLIEEFLE